MTKGIFAAPSEKRCRESFRSAELVKFNAEVRKYQIRTVFQAYYCDARRIVKECDENFLGMDRITRSLWRSSSPQLEDNVRMQ